MTDYHDREPDGTAMETEQDLSHENELRDLVEGAWGCKLIKQQKFDPMDFLAVKGNKTVAWVEMRNRNNSASRYADIFMGLIKFQKLSLAARALYIPAIFVVRFTDAVKWIDLTRIMPKTSYADRGDMKHKRATDNEPCVLIPVSEMKEL